MTHADQMDKPGSNGEHALQERFGTLRRAAAFYDHQMLDHLNPLMLDYLTRQEMAFIATSDAAGECDCSFRAGPPGFVRALDERTVIYPEFRGNGVLGSLGNMEENPHVGILFVDFYESAVGLHVNGRAQLVEDASLRALWPVIDRDGSHALPEGVAGGRGVPERWVLVRVEEAYIHCSKNIPLMSRVDKDAAWASGEKPRSGGDFFRAKHSTRPWAGTRPELPSAREEPVPAGAGNAAGQVPPQRSVAPAPAPAVPWTAWLEQGPTS